MNFRKKHIILAGFLILLIGSYSPVLAQHKTIKAGVGYKQSTASLHDISIHSGRYFFVGYGIDYGSKMKNHFQFQLSNSNREVQFDLPYVSASSSFDISQEFNFPIHIGKKTSYFIGPFVANAIAVNFFPTIDNDNFIWENQTMTGISSRNNFNINEFSSLDFNAQLPIFSTFLSHRFNRFTGESPKTNLSIWEIMDKQLGSINRLFKPKFELGYSYKILPNMSFSLVLQSELDFAKRDSGFRTKTEAHSLSLRFNY